MMMIFVTIPGYGEYRNLGNWKDNTETEDQNKYNIFTFCDKLPQAAENADSIIEY